MKANLTSSVALLAGLALFGVVAAGCGGAHLGQLKEAAAADLNCSPNRVHILNSGKTRDVEACGQRATYHWEDGDWRMIGRSGGAPARGPAPVVVVPAQPQPINNAPPTTATGTPSMPPSSPPPPAAGGKSL